MSDGFFVTENYGTDFFVCTHIFFIKSVPVAVLLNSNYYVHTCLCTIAETAKKTYQNIIQINSEMRKSLGKEASQARVD